MTRLNLGCGHNKMDGYINIDVEPKVNPDLVHDFTAAPLPFEDESVDEIVMFHTIEHIQKRLHVLILSEMWRVMKPDAPVMISFPEFTKCVDNWKRNKGGQKIFWEATIFGRQLFPSDYHVCIMDSHDLIVMMKDMGFKDVIARSEPIETHNSFIVATKGTRLKTHDEAIKQYLEEIRVVVS